MAKRLTPSGRQKLEKEISHDLQLLSANTQECEDYISELEAQLRQQKTLADSAQSSLANTERKLAEATGRIEAQRDDIQTMRTDAKLAALQQASSDKELAQLQSLLEDALNDGQAFADELREKLELEQQALEIERLRSEELEKELAQQLKAHEAFRAAEAAAKQALQDELDAVNVTINEYRECDKALRERIAVLEQLLSEERTKAGQDLLLRIMELETMLEAERNKVDDLEELPTVVHVSHASAPQPRTAKNTSSQQKTESTVKKKASKR